MNQTEIQNAVDEQGEHVKRVNPCGGYKGYNHSYRMFGGKTSRVWDECVVCGVTATRADYYQKRGWPAA